MTQQPSPGDHVRVGHAEREAVTAILQEAAADGRLDMSELEERLEVALQAKTYGELERLVADLSADLPWRTRSDVCGSSGAGTAGTGLLPGGPAPAGRRRQHREAGRHLGRCPPSCGSAPAPAP